jgi:hypothetical protein
VLNSMYTFFPWSPTMQVETLLSQKYYKVALLSFHDLHGADTHNFQSVGGSAALLSSFCFLRKNSSRKA